MERLILLALFVACQFSHLVASIWALVAIVTGSPRALRIIIAYDRVVNAATGGLDTETISSRANRGMNKGNRGWCILCRLLDGIDKDHCKKSAGY
jgi:hypothetical protein